MSDSAESTTLEQLTLFAADSPASQSVMQDSEEARRMTVSSGQRCLGSYLNCVRVTSWARMFLALSLTSRELYSPVSSLTWRLSITKSRRLWYFRLLPSVPHIDGIGSGFVPTPDSTGGAPNKNSNKRNGPKSLIEYARMWPTPVANDDNKSPEAHLAMKARMKGGKRKAITSLQVMVKAVDRGMWRTPRANDWKGGVTGAKGSTRKPVDYFLPDQVNAAEGLILPTPTANRWDGLQSHGVNVVSGQLNAEFVEYLMGFPREWTDLTIPGEMENGLESQER